MMPTPAIDDPLHVIDGMEFHGQINTADEQIRAHVAQSIRLGYPQVKPQPIQRDRVCLVGGGPSLADTVDELRALYFDGARIVTVNGAYGWCLERNLRPSAQIVLDARPDNAAFVDPPVPQCRYLVASQCAPDTWARVAGRDVWIWHAAADDNAVLTPVLDPYYLGQWTRIPGGTTVIMRALSVLRILGFLRFDLFGVDSCFLHGQHHAYAQPLNDGDRPYRVQAFPSGRPDLAREFYAAPWMLKQVECFLQAIKINGSRFVLNVHGDGLLAYVLRSTADVELALNAVGDPGSREG